MKKRGQEAEFNWIFILVAGVIVLGFFAVFIFKYVELQNKKASFEIVRTLNTQLELLERTSSFGENLINLGLVSKVKFSCIGENTKAVVNDQQDLAYSLGDKIVFAPDVIRDKNLGAWIYDWNYPFLVTKFLYLTSSRFRYIIVGTAPEQISKIPENVFDIEYVGSIKEVKDPSNTKIIFFNENNNWDELIKKYPGLEVIYIDTTNKRVTFYNKEGAEPLEYYGDAFLYGAIFAGNYENYKCSLDNGLKKLNYISKIYSRKAYLLSLFSSQECRYSILGDGLGFYEKYIQGTGGMDQNMEGLKEQNMEVHGKGCPALF